MHDTKRYKYRPLLAAENSIRLLQILPGALDTDIHCQIIDYTIRNEQVSGLFEALSYVWGDAADRRPIYVSDHATSGRLDITSNLYVALQHLRDPALPRLMWIDAVCIDQKNLAERASQVNFMANIYSHARQVVVWLGIADDDSGDILAAIEDAADLCCRRPPSFIGIMGSTQWRKHQRAVYQRTLSKLLNRPWFSRIWVLQESAAARSILIKCGTVEMPGYVFTTGLRYLRSEAILGASSVTNQCLSALETMEWNTLIKHRAVTPLLSDSFSESGFSRSTSLGDLLERFYRHEASDKRDKVFALLGLCSPDSRSLIVPDYTKSWDKVWSDAIRQILGSETIVTISVERRQACVTFSGYVIGTIETYRVDKKHLKIHLRPIYKDTSSEYNVLDWFAQWDVESWCKDVEDDDIVFCSAGSKRPTIIRPCYDHFDIVVIALSAHSRVQRDLGPSISWQEFQSCLTGNPKQITAVWDWTPDYPNQCEQHSSLINRNSSKSTADYDRDRKEELAHILSAVRLRWSKNSPAYRWSRRSASSHKFQERLTPAEKSISYLLQQSSTPDLNTPSNMKLRLIQAINAPENRWSYDWFVNTFLIVRWTIWLLKQDTKFNSPIHLMTSYIQSEGNPYCDVFEIMCTLGLELRLSADGNTINMHMISSPKSGNGDHIPELLRSFSVVYHEGAEGFVKVRDAHRKRLNEAKLAMRHHMIQSVLDRYSVSLSDFRVTIADLLFKPLPQFHSESYYVSDQEHSEINYSALSIMAMSQGGKIRDPLFDPDWRKVARSSQALSFLNVLLSASLTDIGIAYKIYSAIFSVEEACSPMSLLQRMSAPPTSKSPSNPGLLENRRTTSGRYEEKGWDPENHPQCSVTNFLRYNLNTIQKYIESTELLEIASATEGDNLLPFLAALAGDTALSADVQRLRESVLGEIAAVHLLFN
jgi:hypothetical protein